MEKNNINGTGISKSTYERMQDLLDNVKILDNQKENQVDLNQKLKEETNVDSEENEPVETPEDLNQNENNEYSIENKNLKTPPIFRIPNDPITGDPMPIGNNLETRPLPMFEVGDNEKLTIDDGEKINDASARRRLKIGLGVAAALGSAVAAGVGISNLLSDDESDKENHSTTTKAVNETDAAKIVENHTSFNDIEELLKSDKVNGIQKNFIIKNKEFMNNFHELTHNPDNFRLTTDGKHYLDFNFAEVMSLNLVLNNYNQDQINNIIGNTRLDPITIKVNVQSAYAKLSVYYMNAKEPSGLSKLIHNEESKKYFEEIENSVIKFNKYRTAENATDVHRQAYYKFIRPGITGAYAQNSNKLMVSYLSTSAFEGFLASTTGNSRDIKEYLISKVDNTSENLSKGIGYLANGTYFENIIKDSSGNWIVNNEDSNPNFKNGNKSIMDFVDKKGLCNELEKYTESLGNMINLANNNKTSNTIGLGQVTRLVNNTLNKKYNNGMFDENSVTHLTNVRRNYYNNLRKTVNSHLTAEGNYNSIKKSNSQNQQKVQAKVVEQVETIKETITTRSEEQQTSTRDYTEKDLISKNEMTANEKTQVEQQEKQISTDNLLHNIVTAGAVAANDYLNSGSVQLTPEIINYFNSIGIDIKSASVANQVRYIKAWNAGNIKESVNLALNEKSKIDADELIKTISESDKYLLKKKYGDNWEDQVKAEYLKGWSNTAIEGLKAATEEVELGQDLKKYEEAQIKLNQNDNNDVTLVEETPEMENKSEEVNEVKPNTSQEDVDSELKDNGEGAIPVSEDEISGINIDPPKYTNPVEPQPELETMSTSIDEQKETLTGDNDDFESEIQNNITKSQTKIKTLKRES